MAIARENVGNGTWQELQRVITWGRGRSGGRLPRGGAALGASPTDDYSQLPAEWADDVANASHVIYHYGTPVAWVDGRDAGWVVPPVEYSVSTSGCQNRIREAVRVFREAPAA